MVRLEYVPASHGSGVDDPYAVLGVPRDATAGAIRKAFRALSLRYHPDKNVTIIATSFFLKTLALMVLAGR